MNEFLASVSPAPSGSSDLDVTRAQLRATLVGRKGATDDRDRILAFLDDHPDAAHRSCAPGHPVSYTHLDVYKRQPSATIGSTTRHASSTASARANKVWSPRSASPISRA